MAKAKGSKGRSRSIKLETEADGRKFAVGALRRLSGVKGDDTTLYPHTRSPETADDLEPYRAGPQTDVFYRDLERLVGSASAEARKGFASALTEVLHDADLDYHAKYFHQLEQAGLLLPFGTRGSDYPVPKLDPKRVAEYEARVARAKAKERTGIAAGQAVAAESFLERNGVARRVALAYLERPCDEVAQKIKTDKKAAEAFAAVAVDLEGSASHYLTIYTYLQDAWRSMLAAIRARKDGDAILARARGAGKQ